MKNTLLIFLGIFMFVTYAYFGFGSSGVFQNQNNAQGTTTTGNNTLANPLQGITNTINDGLR